MYPGLNINHVNNRGESALFHAVRTSSSEVIKMLVQAGHDLTLITNDGETILNEYLRSHKTKD
jgi:ankyrin repeat protein